MRTVILAVLILAIPRWSTAEINMADSIEWSTADSDRVVVGRVAKVVERKGSGSVTWHHVTFAVAETLKGKPEKSIELVVRHLTGDSPATWKARNAELLLFVWNAPRRAARDGGNEGGYTAPFALRPGRWGENDAYRLDGSARAFTTTFDVISKRDVLLATVRAAASSTATKAFQLDTPLGSPAGRALWGGSAVWLYVPIDGALEKLAIGWIKAAEGEVRARGVEVLSHFKTAANIKRLESLLADPATHDITEGSNPPVRRFFVRKRAHQTLRAWGVAHTTPPIDTSVPKP